MYYVVNYLLFILKDSEYVKHFNSFIFEILHRSFPIILVKQHREVVH